MYTDFNSGITVDVYGESHGEYVGVKIYGIIKGEKISLSKICELLERRKSNGLYTTKRIEKDEPIIVSGIVDGYSTGEVIDIKLKNSDVKAEDYEKLKTVLRPSTADYSSYIKYGKIPSGGGKFSGRMTAPLCIAGGIFLQILEEKGITVSSAVYSVKDKVAGKIDHLGGRLIQKKNFAVRAEKIIKKAHKKGDSVGGTAVCFIKGLPAIGGALFEGLEGKIAQAVYAIPSVKGIEFGSGFNGTKKLGSENNDPFITDGEKIKITKNDAGGILGGISFGAPVSMRIAFKPIPSIRKIQNTVDVEKKENTTISIEGRHDCCILFRVLPVIESAVAIAVYSALIGDDKSNSDLSYFREKIDKIDNNVAFMLSARDEIVSKIKEYKLQNKIEVKNSDRENSILSRLKLQYPNCADYIEKVYNDIFEISRKRQDK